MAGAIGHARSLPGLLKLSETVAARAADAVSRAARVIEQIRSLPELKKLSKAVAAHAAGFDLIFANTQKALVVGAFAARAAKKPLLWYLHDIVTADHFSRLNRWLDVVFSRTLVTRVVANSYASSNALLAAGGLCDAVVHNGIDTRSFSDGTERGLPEVRSKLNLTGQPMVGVFGRIASWKGQHVLLQALARLPDVQVLMVGDALFPGDTEYFEDLKQRASAPIISGRVHFLGFRRDIFQVMRLCDVIVHTSIAPEPFGRVIVEGMLAGKPVIATRAGGVPEIIEDGVTGRLVEPNNPEALAAAIQSLLGEPEGTAAMALRGQAFARKRFSLETMTSAMESEIAETLAPEE
jgi:glycosyltransferase involved in cell wall biosynthesis